jgi:4-hydroxy-2-oxoheptanedioate aldolase
VKFLRQKVLSGALCAGVWCNLGSSITVEIAGRSGFDWILIDLEHGAGDIESLRGQLQGAEGTSSVPIVRIKWNEPPLFKRVLDLGASGVMVPYVSNADEATRAAASVRYPPEGIRGVAKNVRATGFGRDFGEYFAKANDNLLTVVQIETKEAIENLGEIAAVHGVDVLFVGPLDLSVSLGIPEQTDHPVFREALAKVAGACQNSGKAAGILIPDVEKIEQVISDGFTFIGVGSDLGIVSAGMKNAADHVERYKRAVEA